MSGWRLRNWRLRVKLAAVLIVPMTAALAFAAFAAVDLIDKGERLERAIEQVDLTATVSELVHALQHERTTTVTGMVDGPATPAQQAGRIAKVDSAAGRLRAAARRLPAGDLAVLVDRVVQRLGALESLRTATTTTEYPVTNTFVAYTALLTELVRMQRELNLAEVDRDLLGQGTTAHAVSEAKEYVAQENAALQIAAGRREFPAGLLERTRAAGASAQAALDGFLATATPRQQQEFSDTVSGRAADGRERLKAAALVRATAGEPVRVDAVRLARDGQATAARLRTVERALLGELRADAVRLAAEANRTAWTVGGVLVAMLAATLALLLVIARSLVNPLRALRAAALNVAYERLPQTVERILADPDPLTAAKRASAPVPVATTEEIGEVARSFDVVQDAAVRLATEQALLRDNVNRILVNLSRRSQLLVERQLGVIDRLESGEQDPDALAGLFELDHLAARLRRNGESLLVLSGERLSRTAAAPLPAADVVRAAVSEVEQFARVEVGMVPEVAIHSRAVNEIVHLLAELLDNATYFSDPQTTVSLRATLTRAGTMALQITDRGVGMTEPELAEANRQLAEPPEVDLSATRRMGLYVVARLAQRHDITVRLRANEDIDGGVIARVEVPAALLTDPKPTEPRPRPEPRPEPMWTPVEPARHEWPDHDEDGQVAGDLPLVSDPDEPQVDGDLPVTEELPIYDEVLSHWFTDAPPEPETRVDAPAADDPGWFSAADDGWQAAFALLEPAAAEVTEVGLPKRVPNAQLVPGSIEPPANGNGRRPARETAAVATVARDRIDGFQRGYREGRHALIDEED